VGYLSALLILIALGILSCLVVFSAADRVSRWLGVTGNVVLTRLLGVILAGLAVQFIIDGVLALIRA
jgi:multiple antibiotic resistance protein